MSIHRIAAVFIGLWGIGLIVFPQAIRKFKEESDRLFRGVEPIKGHPVNSLLFYRVFGVGFVILSVGSLLIQAQVTT